MLGEASGRITDGIDQLKLVDEKKRGRALAYFRDRLKYFKSGGGWSLRVGINKPSALRK